MLRLDPNNLPPHLKAQIERKLKLSGGNQAQSPLPVKESVVEPQILEPTTKPDAQAKSRKQKEMIVVDGYSISVVHYRLWQSVKHLPNATLEFKGAIPNRRFSLDIAFPNLLIAVEVDGWQYHGKYKSSHTRDREKQNLLTLVGWRVLRYTAKQIYGDIEQCVSEIERLIQFVSKT